MSEEVTVNPGKVIGQVMRAIRASASSDRAVREDEVKLPMPTKQEIHGDTIEWTWDVGGDNISVESCLYQNGDYEVDICCPDPGYLSAMKPEVAFALGQALSAAGGYVNNWQAFAGKFIAESFFNQEGQVGKETVGKGMQLAREANERGEIVVREVSFDRDEGEA